MGGTFDHLHEGHKFLLKTALSISEFVEIGLTTQSLLENKEFYSELEDYQTRQEKLKDFVKTLTNLERINIVEIKNWDDMNRYAQDPEYDGLVVSQETYENAVKLSETREEIGLKPLILIVIPIFRDKNNQKLSSTSIRKKL